MDGDGRRDILSGSYSSEDEKTDAGLFYVLRGKPDGTFGKAEVLKGTDGEPLVISTDGNPNTGAKCTRPFAVDWDGDGHLDLVAGNSTGSFHWFKGEGKGKFRPKTTVIKTGKEPLRIDGRHSDPFVIDWNGDGSLDLVSGSSAGGVYWARNKAGTLLGREGDLTCPTTCTRVWVADVNGDGKLDLLVGDNVLLVVPVKQIPFGEFKKKYADWEKNFLAAVAAVDSARDEKSRKKAIAEFETVYRQRTAFLREDRTGFVWLYLQK